MKECFPDANQRAIADLVGTLQGLCERASVRENFDAAFAERVRFAGLVVAQLIKAGAGTLSAGQALGVGAPTGRGAFIHHCNPGRVATTDRSHLDDVPRLVYGAWQSLLRYREEPRESWMHLESAAWRLADASLALQCVTK